MQNQPKPTQTNPNQPKPTNQPTNQPICHLCLVGGLVGFLYLSIQTNQPTKQQSTQPTQPTQPTKPPIQTNRLLIQIHLATPWLCKSTGIAAWYDGCQPQLKHNQPTPKNIWKNQVCLRGWTKAGGEPKTSLLQEETQSLSWEIYIYNHLLLVSMFFPC